VWLMGKGNSFSGASLSVGITLKAPGRVLVVYRRAGNFRDTRMILSVVVEVLRWASSSRAVVV